jgi:hypothetical protein
MPLNLYLGGDPKGLRALSHSGFGWLQAHPDRSFDILSCPYSQHIEVLSEVLTATSPLCSVFQARWAEFQAQAAEEHRMHLECMGEAEHPEMHAVEVVIDEMRSRARVDLTLAAYQHGYLRVGRNAHTNTVEIQGFAPYLHQKRIKRLAKDLAVFTSKSYGRSFTPRLHLLTA